MKNNHFLKQLLASMTLTTTILFSAQAQAFSEPFLAPASGTLFSSYDVKNFELSADFTALLAAKANGFLQAPKTEVEGLISYQNDNSEKVSVPVKIRLRGFTSLGFCSFPKMEIKISKKDSVNTLFQGIKSVDINTHCIEIEDPTLEPHVKEGYYNHREAYVYRIMDILNMPTLRARPVLFQYTDINPESKMTADPKKSYQAFFVEDMGDLRKRNNLLDIKGVYDPTKMAVDPADTEKLAAYTFTNVAEVKTDLQDLVRIAALQWLVGNTDWYLKISATDQRNEGDPIPNEPNLWNIKSAKTQDGKVIFIPQDFNFSALAMGYSSGAFLNQKIFNMGDKETQIAVLKMFLAKKEDILALIPASEKADQNKELMQNAFFWMDYQLKQLLTP